MPETTWHSMEDIVGIGPSISSELIEYGYSNAESLLKSNRRNTASILEPINGLSTENLIGNYCLQARLLRLINMEPDLANLFVKGGYDYTEITFQSLDRIEKFIIESGFNVSKEQILQWQLDSSKRRFTSTVYLNVFDENGEPVNDASVYVDDPSMTGVGISWHWKSNASGHALIEYLIPGKHEIIVIKDEKYSKHIITVTNNQYLEMNTYLVLDAPEGIVHDENIHGPLIEDGATIRVNIKKKDLVNNDILEISRIDGDTYRLSKILRKKKGSNWYIESIDVNKTSIPGNHKMQSLIQYKNKKYAPIDGVKEKVRWNLRQQTLVNHRNLIGG